tara:strand:- start:3739 stop:5040 length:1302 start_codon:yes stop_codon:yes gene_type:complete
MNKIKLNSWGKFTDIDAYQYSWNNIKELKTLITSNKSFIPSGNFRSYGDSAFSDNIINCKINNRVLSFEKSSGVLKVQAGITLSKILSFVIPYGWFLGVTPGTKYSTLGGVIASDVHGKNHHINGCFSEYVLDIDLMLPNGAIVNLKKDDELFKATCGGMGLTGVIVNATIKLIKIKSTNINQTTIKTNDLAETFDVFEKYSHKRYSVAWFDGFASGKNFGRSIIQIGDFAADGDIKFKDQSIKFIPFKLFSLFLNKYIVYIFNYIYYSFTSSKKIISKVHFTKFFYPLDKFSNWNKIYGKNGLIQYQFILPLEKSYDGIKDIFSIIQKRKIYPFLAVLKLYGEKNDNFISFPIKGYSLALDFKRDHEALEMLKDLDSTIVKYGGRVYLTKDAHVNELNFKKMYPDVNKFIKIRKKYYLDEKMKSSQSMRIGI